MICPKCGNELNENNICLNCNKKNNSNSKIIIKWIIGILVFSLVLGIGVYIYKYFNVKEELKWNEMYEAYNLKNIEPVNVILGIDFTNEDELKNIKYDVTCGKYEVSGYEINWDLTEASGKCKIKVSYKSKSIEKEFYVFNIVDDEELAVEMDEIDLDSDDDFDLDGLTNKQEKEYNTNPKLSDSDLDGLDDNYEISTSKTDPNKADTDGDGLSDYSEIKLNLDPNKADSLGDGIKDGDRKLEYTYEKNNIRVNISGKGNIADMVIETYNDTKLSNRKGTINKLYSFETKGNLESATVTIPYTTDDIKKYNLNEENLSLYYYNTKTGKYEKIETTVDKKNKVLTAKLSHFSFYVVSSEELDKLVNQIQILFILDNSWSMYSEEQIKKYINEEVDGEIGYDKDGLRFKLTSNMIKNFSDEKYKIGLSEFRYDYANAYKIGSNKNDMISILPNMMGNFITKDAGTNISNALSKGLKEFDDVGEKYIVILTDGNDENLNKKRNEIIQDALDKGVHICSIGFGGSTGDDELKAISIATGCKYFSSSNADGLNELFDSLEIEVNNDLVDSNDDGKVDSILLATTNFVVNRDGFSFHNYSSKQSGGHCYGMALFAELYYMNLLPFEISPNEVRVFTNYRKSYPANLNFDFFKNHNNLYDYKVQTPELLYYRNHFESSFNEEQIKVLDSTHELVGTNALYTEEHKNRINNAGFYDIIYEDNNENNDFEQYEYVQFNEEKMQNSNMVESDKQLFNAIFSLYLIQAKVNRYYSGMSFQSVLNHVGRDILYDSALTEFKTIDILDVGFIDVLVSRIKNDDPVTIGITMGAGNHAINALAVYKDVNELGLYHIKVYDNNAPGETRILDLKCSEDSCLIQPNQYYTKKEPICMSLSINEELDFLNPKGHTSGGSGF